MEHEKGGQKAESAKPTGTTHRKKRNEDPSNQEGKTPTKVERPTRKQEKSKQAASLSGGEAQRLATRGNPKERGEMKGARSKGNSQNRARSARSGGQPKEKKEPPQKEKKNPREPRKVKTDDETRNEPIPTRRRNTPGKRQREKQQQAAKKASPKNLGEENRKSEHRVRA